MIFDCSETRASGASTQNQKNEEKYWRFVVGGVVAVAGVLFSDLVLFEWNDGAAWLMESINQTVRARCLLLCFMNVYFSSWFKLLLSLVSPINSFASFVRSACGAMPCTFFNIFVWHSPNFYNIFSSICYDEFGVIPCFCLLSFWWCVCAMRARVWMWRGKTSRFVSGERRNGSTKSPWFPFLRTFSIACAWFVTI